MGCCGNTDAGTRRAGAVTWSMRLAGVEDAELLAPVGSATFLATFAEVQTGCAAPVGYAVGRGMKIL